jgi:fibronectin-binding autotransporter adhesin
MGRDAGSLLSEDLDPLWAMTHFQSARMPIDFKSRLRVLRNSAAMVLAVCAIGAPLDAQAQAVTETGNVLDWWGDYMVGRSTAGMLAIAGGGTLAKSGSAYLGYNGGAQGTATVTGANSLFSVSGNLTIGYLGSGSLTIDDGGRVTNMAGNIALGGGVTSTVLVKGANSLWDNSGNLTIGGSQAFGFLTIENGGRVNSTSASIAQSFFSEGTVTVTGAGSLWNNSGALVIGDGEKGTLTIENGGRVNSASATLGNKLYSSGSTTVTGTSSVWANNGRLIIGNGDRAGGTLTISNGATVRTGSYAGGVADFVGIAGVATASGTLNIGAASGAAAATAGTLLADQIRFALGTGTIVFNHTGLPDGSDLDFVAALRGKGSIKHESGTTILSGDGSAFTGSTAVSGGKLVVANKLGGSVVVSSGATLAGSGTIGSGGASTITLQSGALLSPGNSPGTLTIDGNLSLANGSTSRFELNMPGAVGGPNDLVKVTGTLTLGGTLDARVASAGYYRLFDYGGLTPGSTFDGETVTSSNFTVARHIVGLDAPGQVYLIALGAGQTIQFWDGGNTMSNGAADGGSGLWDTIGPNWTSVDGVTNQPWLRSVGVFAGSAGTVTVAGTRDFDTLQFVTDGYHVTGGSLAFNPASGSTGTIAVDGGVTAVVDSVLVDGTTARDLAKAGSGTLVLNAANSHTGTTIVSGGKLVVGDDAHPGASLVSAVTVKSGASLGGIGTLGGLMAASGAIVAPGNSIGTLNIAGDVTFAAGSTYAVEIAGNGASDRIAATGTATLSSGKVEVTALDAQASYQNGQRYTILTAAGGVIGGFDPAVLSRSAFLDATLLQGANAVDLTIAIKKPEEPGEPEEPGKQPLFASVADTVNRTHTATALDTLQQSGAPLALYNTLLVLSADEARAAFDSLSGEVHASTVTGLLEDSRFVRDAVNDRLRSAFETVGGLPLMGYGDDAKEITTASVASERYGAWGSVFGSWGHFGGDGNAARLSRSTGGFVTGVDGLITDDVRLGFLAGYSHSSFKVDDRRSSASSDNYHLGVYGGTQWGALSFRSGLAYTWSEIDTSRQVTFPGFSDSLTGSYRAGTTQMFGELGYSLKAGSVAFEPFANLAYVNVHTNGFAEQGGASALTVHGGSNDSTFTTLGLRASTDFDVGSTKATVRGMIGWRHAYGDVTPAISQAFTGSSAFTIAGAPIARDSAVIEAGLDFAITPQATLGLSYHGQVGSKASDHGVRADLNVKF